MKGRAVSYRSREKKRRKKAAMNAAKGHADRHYLTMVKQPACCNKCGRPLRHRAECVFRYRPMEILCKGCADERRIQYRISRRWEAANRKLQGGKLMPRPRVIRETQEARDGDVAARHRY
jgi:hypothetical protein